MTELRGRGAWSQDGIDNTTSGLYLWRKDQGDTATGSHPSRSDHHRAVHFGVRATQQRLIEFGVAGFPAPTGTFGPLTTAAVRDFQKLAPMRGWRLGVDGIVGRETAKCLWVDLVRWYAAYRPAPVPAGHVWGMMGVESVYDPGAVSFRYQSENGPDYGLCQINIHFNPQASYEEAFDPHYAIDFTCDRLEVARAEYAGKGTDLQAKCSIASHNSPALADRWFEDGFPPPPTPERPHDIALYVQRVEERAASFV